MINRKAISVIAAAVMAIALLCACGNSSKDVSIDLQSFYQGLEQSVDMSELHALTEKKIKSTYGIDAQQCPQIIIARSNNALVTDEVWLIEAPDSATAGEFAAKAQECITQKCQENENYLPDQYAVAKDGRVVTAGNYVALFVSPKAEDMENMFLKSAGK